ncbi:MAG: hypothetical protein WC140_00055 [Bacteroidales bacterium]
MIDRIQEIDALKDRLFKLSVQEIEDLKSTISNVVKENLGLKENIKLLNKEISVLNKEIKQSHIAINELQKDVSQIEKLVGQVQGQPIVPSESEPQMKDLGGILFPIKEVPEKEIELDDDVDQSISFELENVDNSPLWLKDTPSNHLDSILDGMSLNDKMLFVAELFYNDQDQFDMTMDRIDDMATFEEILQYLRGAFPEWNENSDNVYNFYMTVRRKFVK